MLILVETHQHMHTSCTSWMPGGLLVGVCRGVLELKVNTTCVIYPTLTAWHIAASTADLQGTWDTAVELETVLFAH